MARRWGLWAGLLLAVLAASPARAQPQKPSSNELLEAVVGLEVQVRGDARTAATLGTERKGSGVIIDDEGLVLTIGYLIVEASEVTLRPASGAAVPARVVAYDHRSGFGLLRALSPLGGRALKLGDSAKAEEDDAFLVIGRDRDPVVSVARLMERKTFTGSWEYLIENAIFTAPAHPRYGGAALVNEKGELMGIGSLLLQQRVPGVGEIPGNMFVPIDELKPILGELLSEGKRAGTAQPWLGIGAEAVRGHLFVERISAEGPADKAGIKPGDLVLGIGGEKIGDLATFYRRIWALGPPGTEIPLDVVQGGQVKRVGVRSTDRNARLKLDRSY